MAKGRDDEAIRANAAAAGLRVEIAPEPETEVWPDHWRALEVAVRMLSQLNVGFSGPVGFRFESLPVLMDALAIPSDARLAVIDDLRIVEAELIHQLRGGR